MASKNHIMVGHRALSANPYWCIGCKRRIFYGERCQRCQQELRQRRRRKPR